MRQIWRHLGFFHWPIDAAAIARLLPPGLEVDTFEGAGLDECPACAPVGSRQMISRCRPHRVSAGTQTVSDPASTLTLNSLTFERSPPSSS